MRLWLHVNDAAVRYHTKTAYSGHLIQIYMCLGFIFLENIWFKTGNKDSMRYSLIHMIVDNLGQSSNSFTLSLSRYVKVPVVSSGGGRSSARIITERGKTKHGNFTDLQKSLDESLTRLEELRNMADLPGTLADVCISFQPHGQERDIERLCCKIFCKKPGQNETLPPCKDIIVKHCRRVNCTHSFRKCPLCTD